MKPFTKNRTHLVERAVEALGGTAGLASPGPAPAAQPQPQPRPAVPPRTVPAAEVAPPRVPITAEALSRAGLITLDAVRSRLSEEFAVVYHQILGAASVPVTKGGRQPRLVLVTSARPGEGKSFTALNIAAGMAVAGGRHVVLVDADGKRGSLSDLLGCADEPGLRALAADPARDPRPLLVPTVHERLSILPYSMAGREAGAAPSSTAIAAVAQPLAAALPEHVILFDSPPCLSTSEASMLASVVGQVVMVVEAEKTQRSEVEAALDMVDACPTLQLLLNQTHFTSTETFGAYGYGVYGGSYRDAPAGT